MADPRLRSLSLAHHPLVHVASALWQQPCQNLITLDFPPQRREERNTTVVAACDYVRGESAESEGSQLNAAARALALVETECRGGHGLGCNQHGDGCRTGGHGSRHTMLNGAGRRDRKGDRRNGGHPTAGPG